MYENQIVSLIRERMLQRMDPNLDKREGSMTYDFITPPSIELEQAYIELENVLNFGFADTTYGKWLVYRASEVGLTKKVAVKSTGQLILTGPTSTFFPKGTQITTDSVAPIIVETLYDVTITTTTVTVDAIALVAGTSGNVSANTLNAFVDFDTQGGLVTVTNTTSFEDGFAEETDEEFLFRYKIRVQNTLATGNETHYRLLATEVPGVVDARIYSRWNGNGTVKVVCLSTSKKAPSDVVLQAVRDNIDANMLLGSEITVAGVEEVTIDVSVALTLVVGATVDQAKEELIPLLESYFASLAFNDLVVRYSRIGDRILEAIPVVDYQSLTINLLTSNVTVQDHQVPVLGSLTITTI